MIESLSNVRFKLPDVNVWCVCCAHFVLRFLFTITCFTRSGVSEKVNFALISKASVIFQVPQNICIGLFTQTPNVSTIEINQVFAEIGFENKLSFLLGDFKINIVSADSHSPTN